MKMYSVDILNNHGFNETCGISKDDPKSFIFSLTDNKNKPLKLKWLKNISIECDNT